MELKHQKLFFYKLRESIIKQICHGVKQNANICAIGETECKVFISGGQRREIRDSGEARGRRERIEKGSIERIEIERKEIKVNRVNNLERRIKNIDTCLCLLFSFLKALHFS